MAKVGFVGLGVMGGPMAGHLIQADHQVMVWNRTPGKADPLRDSGAIVADSLKQLGRENAVVCLCVGRTEDVEQCLSELTVEAAPETLFIDHSTIAPTGAIRIYDELKAMGFGFVDAPITGGSMGAQKGQLTIFLGGEDASIDEAKPIVSAYAKRAEKVGGPGAGQMMKMANQIAVGGALLALCESLSFAKKAGLDLAQVRELLGGGAAGSWAFENYGPKIINEDWSPGFSVKNQRKDFGYCFDAADKVGAAIPGTLLVDGLLDALTQEGHEEWATVALYEVLLSMGHKA